MDDEFFLSEGEEKILLVEVSSFVEMADLFNSL